MTAYKKPWRTGMRARDIIGDIIGVIVLFGGGYAFLIMAYGMGF
jgi:hypothetical protein